MLIRKLEPQETELHRQVRLQALKDSPDSFGQTHSEAEAKPSEFWQELTQSVTKPDHQVLFLACDGDLILGCAYGLLNRDRQDLGHVGGMWVDPEQRRKGIGSRLLLSVITWAQERELIQLELWAPEHNPGAVSLYQQAGFCETGNHRPFPGKSSLQIIQMERDV